MSKKSPLISIIIVVRNDRGIDATLSAVEAQDINVSQEIIVIDASRLETLADIRLSHPSIKWLQYPYSNKRTTPAQRNLGIETASGELIVFLDANCIPGERWFSGMVEAFKSGENIICGPVHDKGQDLVHYAPELDQPTYVDVCTTISVGISRKVFEEVGNFDETFAYGQDIDFMWRATERGFNIYYSPDVSITHDWGGSNEQLRRAFEYGKARAHLFKKHWHSQKRRLIREVHVWTYPIFIIGLPLTYFFPFYPLLVVLPLIKNRHNRPVGLLLHHLSYGLGVIAGALISWPTPVNPSTKSLSFDK